MSPRKGPGSVALADGFETVCASSAPAGASAGKTGGQINFSAAGGSAGPPALVGNHDSASAPNPSSLVGAAPRPAHGNAHTSAGRKWKGVSLSFLNVNAKRLLASAAGTKPVELGVLLRTLHWPALVVVTETSGTPATAHEMPKANAAG